MVACWTQRSTTTNSQKDFDVSVETVTNLTLTSKIFHVDFKPTNGKKNAFAFSIYYHGVFEHWPPSFLQIQLNPNRILIIESMTSMNSSTVRRLAPTQRPT